MTDPVFFTPSPGIAAGKVAECVGAAIPAPEHARIIVTHAASAQTAGAGSLIYAEDKRHAEHLASTKASAVLCKEEYAALVPPGVAVLVTAQPQAAFAAALRLLYPDAISPGAMTGETGRSGHAFVSPDALVEDDVIIEAGAVIGPHAAIGAGSVIGPNAVVGPGCQIGRGCYVGAGSTIQHALIGNHVVIHPGSRIGQDGFGYLGTREGPEKVLQVGRVIIQDDVEIGANVAIDRGALDDTVIGERTKIDNLCQIAHNVVIGRCCVIAGTCGISGSVRIGDYVRIGGGAGFSDHVVIGDGAQIAAGSGVMHEVPAGESWGGVPAQPMRAYWREVVGLRAKQRMAVGHEEADKAK